MSVRPSLYSYVNPKGDLYIKTTGGKRTSIYWVKNEFVRKSQPNVIEPNSVVQMKNQVLADRFPQNPGLAHNNKSQEFQMDKIKAQIDKLRRLG